MTYLYWFLGDVNWYPLCLLEWLRYTTAIRVSYINGDLFTKDRMRPLSGIFRGHDFDFWMAYRARQIDASQEMERKWPTALLLAATGIAWLMFSSPFSGGGVPRRYMIFGDRKRRQLWELNICVSPLSPASDLALRFPATNWCRATGLH